MVLGTPTRMLRSIQPERRHSGLKAALPYEIWYLGWVWR